MIIADSLRKECMPGMVYSLVKLARYKAYKKEDFRRLITLGNSETAVYEKVFGFSCECGFIRVNDNNEVVTGFKHSALSDFRSFRYAVAKDVFSDRETSFTLLVKWLLSQGSDVFKYKSAEDFATDIPKELGSFEKDAILGCRYWLVALGLCMLQKAGSGSTMVFACHNFLIDWLEFERPFEIGTSIPVKQFINRLLKDCPQFTSAVNGNDIRQSLSMALRVLENSEVLTLNYIPDSSDIWHLTTSISYENSTNISEIIVR